MNGCFLIGLVVVILIGALSPEPTAADGDWHVFLYNENTDALIQVYHGETSDGSFDTYQWSTPHGWFKDNAPTTFFGTSNKLEMKAAACLYDSDMNSSLGVYAPYEEKTLVTYETGSVIGCNLGERAFNEDGSLVAFGVQYRFPLSESSPPDWEVLIIDTTSGAIVNRLTSMDPAVVALGQDYAGILPKVQEFRDGIITVTPEIMAGGGGLRGDSFLWDVSAGTVVLGDWQGRASLDENYDQTDRVWLEVNDNFPKGTNDYLTPYNVVMEKIGEEEALPIFNNGETVLLRAILINGGSQIAVFVVDQSDYYWIVIDREGNSTPLNLPDDVGGNDVRGTNDGFVYLTNASGVTELRLYRSGDVPEETVLWSDDIVDEWRIAWAVPVGEP